MEVVLPTAVNDFHFDSTASSPYVSAPSSPKRFGDPFDYYYHYTSAPTSPSRVAAIVASSSSVLPFGWGEIPGTPRSTMSDVGCGAADLDDFAFDFSGQMEKGVPDLTAADELFDKGKIRPLKPPPRLCNLSMDAAAASAAPRSPKSPNSRGLWSPRVRGGKDVVDPFTAAMVEATRERGRERDPAVSSISSSRSRKGSRSLSPMRSGEAGGFFLKPSSSPRKNSSTAASTATIATECLKTTSSGGNSRKWRLRDLLLFRSASEGRVTGNKSKDPLRKYTIMSQSNSPSSMFSPSPKRKGGEDSRNSSFRSTDSAHGSMRRGGGPAVSAHEMHYTSNRAASEEMKKKTALPFNRQGLFGFLRFNPAVNGIARGFRNSNSFGRRQFREKF